MRCDTARLLLAFDRPGRSELDPTDKAAVRDHLANCPECRVATDDARRMDEHVGRWLRQIELPPDGLASTLSCLRGRARREQFRRAAWACAMLIAGVVAWRTWPASSFNAVAIADAAYQQVANRAGVEEWLSRQDSRFRFPPRFIGRQLVAAEKRSFHGVTAPVLVFASNNAVARVAIVDETSFRNLATMESGLQGENSVCSVHVLRDPNQPGVVYLVEALNGPIDLFLADEDSAAT